MIAYIDESKAKSYLFAVHLVAPNRQIPLRKILSQQLLAGQRSFHFRKESDRRRIRLIRLLIQLDVRVMIFKIAGCSDVEARNLLIREICSSATRYGIQDLVFELDRSCISNDIGFLNVIRPAIGWDHRERHQEPLLWVADAVAWCVNRGGEWERMVRPMIVETIDC